MCRRVHVSVSMYLTIHVIVLFLNLLNAQKRLSCSGTCTHTHTQAYMRANSQCRVWFSLVCGDDACEQCSLLQCVSRTSIPILIPFRDNGTHTFAYTYVSSYLVKYWQNNWGAFASCLRRALHWGELINGRLHRALCLSPCLFSFVCVWLGGGGQLALPQLENFELMGQSQSARFQAFYTFQRFLPLFICNSRQITRTITFSHSLYTYTRLGC